MPKKIQIAIKEDVDFLDKLLVKTSGSLKKDRIKTLILIKKGKYVFYSSIAKKLGRTEKTVRGWAQEYLKSGISEMLSVRSGGNNTKKISEKMANAIEQKLNDPKTTITSYVELLKILEKELNESVNYGALYAHCKRKHQSKLKVARKSHYKKDENAEAFFKKTLKTNLKSVELFLIKITLNL
ncbi:helix-turn-helix domain-containing protein [Flavobacterium davisii]|uniref:Helix-turn-helix domain-containing protein n=3 Tax=Flavobacterium TaxID=237 RepID=A0A8G0KW44_9FLAO|nr:helix-turn-helix domain-containing protein [Flavobacterium davisii]QYS90210.1 helix-turn-helix domain-containing protein [Flavobacterium davisii]